MVAYRTGSDPIEIGSIGPKVKVTVTENLCLVDEKKSLNILMCPNRPNKECRGLR